MVSEWMVVPLRLGLCRRFTPVTPSAQLYSHWRGVVIRHVKLDRDAAQHWWAPEGGGRKAYESGRGDPGVSCASLTRAHVLLSRPISVAPRVVRLREREQKNNNVPLADELAIRHSLITEQKPARSFRCSLVAQISRSNSHVHQPRRGRAVHHSEAI